jgi:tetratricopeptide (TPR) repeat protein
MRGAEPEPEPEAETREVRSAGGGGAAGGGDVATPTTAAWLVRHDDVSGDTACAAGDLFHPPLRISPPRQQHQRGVCLVVVNQLLDGLSGNPCDTTKQVIEAVIFPTTQPHKASGFDMLHGLYVRCADGRLRSALAEPTHFVSHAWSTPFAVTLSAVNAWCDENAVASADVFLWLDVLCLNQHAEIPGTPGITEEELAGCFARSVETAGHTLFVCAPWDHPQALTRCWCLYEILETMRRGAEFSVCLPPEERDSFAAAMLVDYESVERQVLAVDVRKASAFSEAERDMIFSWIEGAGGFAAMNSTVKTALRKWILNAGLRELRAIEQKHSSGHLSWLRFARALAGNLVDNSRLPEADVLYEQAHRGFVAHEECGPESFDALEVMNGVGELRLKQRRPEDAASAYREALGGICALQGTPEPDSDAAAAEVELELGRENSAELLRRTTSGSVPESSARFQLEAAALVALNGLGNMAVQAKNYGEAEAYYKRCAAGREKLFGAGHQDTLKVINDLGGLRLREKRLSEAESLFRHVVLGNEKLLGANDPRTLNTANSLANVLKLEKRFAEAEPFARRALEGNTEQLGPKDPRTLNAANSLAHLLTAQQKFEEAEPLLRQVMQENEARHGATHKFTLYSAHTLATALSNMGKIDDAEPLLRRIVAANIESDGEGGKKTLSSLHTLGQALMRRPERTLVDAAEAEALFRRVHAGNIAVFGAADLRTKLAAGSLVHAATARGVMGAAQEAIETLRRHEAGM